MFLQSKGKIIQRTKLAEGIFQMAVQMEQMPKSIFAGQFLNVQLPSKEKILRRPFGISSFNLEEKTLTFCFQIRGGGTQLLSGMETGQILDILFPLGTGFPTTYKKVMLIGGGIGVFPLLAVTKQSNCYSFLGYRNASLAVLQNEFKNSSAELHMASDDGSVGEKGFVTELARREFDRIQPDAIFACGPLAMFKAIRKTFEGVHVPIYASFEERMGCGFGVCLGCAIKVKVGGEEKVLRVCREGPVFKLEDVIFE